MELPSVSRSKAHEREFAEVDELESLSQPRWHCKYQIVFIPKCRRKVPYGVLRKHLAEIVRRLAEHRAPSLPAALSGPPE